MTGSEAYSTLGLQDGSEAALVRSAFKQLAKMHHPDRGGDATNFQEISEAYAVLLGTAPSAAMIPAKVPTTCHRKDVVRGLAVTAGGAVLTMDERSVTVEDRATGQQWEALASDETLLCCCLLHDGATLAVGTSVGNVHLVDVGRETEAGEACVHPITTHGKVVHHVSAPAEDEAANVGTRLPVSHRVLRFGRHSSWPA